MEKTFQGQTKSKGRSLQRRSLCICLLALLLLSLAGCGQAQQATENPALQLGQGTQPGQGGELRKLEDMAGRPITLTQPATKIVALQASDVEILYELGAGDKLVAVGRYCDYPALAQEKKRLGSGSETNIEEIMSLQPDVVIMGAMAQTSEQVEQLTRAGIQVVITHAQDIAGTYAAIELLGAVIGEEAAAEALVKTMKQGFIELQQRAQALKSSLKIYYEVSPLSAGLWTTGNHTFLQEITELLGQHNLFEDVKGWAQISQEQVIARNPDLIVTLTMYCGEGQAPAQEILERPGWEIMKAVQNKAIFKGDGDKLTRPGPRLVEGGAELLSFIEKSQGSR